MSHLICTAGVLLGLLAGSVDGMQIRNTDGVAIDVNVLNLEEERVYVELQANGRATWIPLEKLDQESRKALKEWDFRNNFAESVKFDFREKTVGKTDLSSNIRRGEAETIVFEISVENLLSTDLSEIVIEYRIMYREERMGRSKDKFAQNKLLTGRMVSPPIPPGETITMDTKEITLEDTKMRPGWSMGSGVSDPAKDEIEGFWFRVHADDTVLYEDARPAYIIERRNWDNPWEEKEGS